MLNDDYPVQTSIPNVYIKMWGVMYNLLLDIDTMLNYYPDVLNYCDKVTLARALDVYTGLLLTRYPPLDGDVLYTPELHGAYASWPPEIDMDAYHCTKSPEVYYYGDLLTPDEYTLSRRGLTILHPTPRPDYHDLPLKIVLHLTDDIIIDKAAYKPVYNFVLAYAGRKSVTMGELSISVNLDLPLWGD